MVSVWLNRSDRPSWTPLGRLRLGWPKCRFGLVVWSFQGLRDLLEEDRAVRKKGKKASSVSGKVVVEGPDGEGDGKECNGAGAKHKQQPSTHFFDNKRTARGRSFVGVERFDIEYHGGAPRWGPGANYLGMAAIGFRDERGPSGIAIS